MDSRDGQAFEDSIRYETSLFTEIGGNDQVSSGQGRKVR